jgi:hypothetical protein
MRPSIAGPTNQKCEPAPTIERGRVDCVLLADANNPTGEFVRGLSAPVVATASDAIGSPFLLRHRRKFRWIGP